MPTTRPRREGCEGSRGRAEPPAGETRPGPPDGSAAGARGARAAWGPAAARGERNRPVLRLPRVVAALQEVPGSAWRTAARTLRLRHGACRGGGGEKPG